MTKAYRSHVGTPVRYNKVRPEDGHRTDDVPPTPKPKADSSASETAEQAMARRFREGGKD
jgi:hypothetical protein